MLARSVISSEGGIFLGDGDDDGIEGMWTRVADLDRKDLRGWSRVNGEGLSKSSRRFPYIST